MTNAGKRAEAGFAVVHLSPAPWVATAAGLVILFFGMMTTFAVGIYSGGWSGGASQWAARVFPFPAAFVDKRAVWVRDVLDDTEAFLAYRGAHPEVQATALSREDIQKNVLARLVQTARIEQLAAERGIVVTHTEVDAEFALARQQNAGQLEDMLRQFGWSEAEFKSKVIRVYLLQNRLRGTLGEEALDAALADESRIVYLMRH